MPPVFPEDLSPVVAAPPSSAERSLPSTVPSSAAFSTPPSREPPCGFRPIHAPPAPTWRYRTTTGWRHRPDRPLATSSPPAGSYTRERLLGAVQRVRCGAAGGRALRHGAPELAPRDETASVSSSGRGSSAGAAQSRGDSLQGELHGSRVPDHSVDENYEFDPALSPALGDTWHEHGLSDGELYGGTQWDAEARCAALKQEFLRFRRRRRPLESAC